MPTYKEFCDSVGANPLPLDETLGIGAQRLRTHLANKQRAVALLGGRCQVCGYSKCMRALEFHRVDPNTKRFNISSSDTIDLGVVWARAWDSIVREIRKCVLVCSNCHREIESGLTKCPPMCTKK